ncbi:MAG: MFS transporter [Polyangiaceae bacterium]|nr:MFS transporter [Polyangiaceae bacterium]
MAGVQFANVLDFMMVNPLGPQLAQDPSMQVPTSQLPLVIGSYTAAASITGVLGSFFLERFDRRSALFVTLLGLAVGTALGGMAQGLASLILARIVAGLFGGPATSLAFAIVSDAIPSRRRGWAMGIVMGGFSVASVLGVPAGLNLAKLGGWRTPFWGVALLIGCAAIASLRLLPPLRAHLARASSEQSAALALFNIMRKPVVALSLAMTTFTMLGVFIVIPNIPAFVQFNLGFDGNRLDVLYLLGGVASFVTTRFTGPLVDRFGSTRVAVVGSILVGGLVYVWFVAGVTAIPVLVVSTAFFLAMAMRGVAYNTLTSKVPEPHERARFQSVQSAVQHGATAAAAFLSAQILSELPDHRLEHLDRVGIVSIVMVAIIPILMTIVERLVRERPAASSRSGR